MEHTAQKERWRIWVNPRQRLVSFHEEKNFDLLEFHNHDLFIHCLEEYMVRQYRYQ